MAILRIYQGICLCFQKNRCFSVSYDTHRGGDCYRIEGCLRLEFRGSRLDVHRKDIEIFEKVSLVAPSDIAR